MTRPDSRFTSDVPASWPGYQAWTSARPDAAARLHLAAIRHPTWPESASADGSVTWDAPNGEWRLLRIGHRSTLVTNNPAGAGQGLEADKFNPAAARVQFDSWFGEARFTRQEPGEGI